MAVFALRFIGTSNAKYGEIWVPPEYARKYLWRDAPCLYYKNSFRYTMVQNVLLCSRSIYLQVGRSDSLSPNRGNSTCNPMLVAQRHNTPPKEKKRNPPNGSPIYFQITMVSLLRQITAPGCSYNVAPLQDDIPISDSGTRSSEVETDLGSGTGRYVTLRLDPPFDLSVCQASCNGNC